MLNLDQFGIWAELVTLGALIWLGYIGARLVARFNLPSVTGFLLVGVAVGPHGLALLNIELLHKIEFVNPLALGLIVFLIGEELTARMLARHHWSFWVTAVLGVALPAVFVIAAAGALRPGQDATAWVLASIAMSGAPATLMSVLAETKAKGRSCDMLLGAAAFSDIATVVGFAGVSAVLMVRRGLAPSFGEAAAATGIGIAGGVVLGIAFGLVLGQLLRRAGEQGEMLSLGLTHVLLVVALARLLDVSVLLAPLAMGITVAVMEERRGAQGRCFSALRTVEYPVYIIFFTLAGAELDLRIVVQGGVLMLAYITARAVGKILAGFAGGLLGGLGPARAGWFGLGSLPQAGVAVGLALSAGTAFPEIGPTVTAVVLASIVFFEAVGPMAAKTAMVRLDCDAENVIPETGPPVCRERTVLVPVSHHWSSEKLLGVLDATEGESECPSAFVLAHVVTPGRAYTEAEALARGQATLLELARVASGAGHRIDTRIVSARQVDVAVARLANELDADLVVLGTPPSTAQRRFNSLARTPLHRIIDRLKAPVFIVPEEWIPRATGARIASTVAAADGSPDPIDSLTSPDGHSIEQREEPSTRVDEPHPG